MHRPDPTCGYVVEPTVLIAFTINMAKYMTLGNVGNKGLFCLVHTLEYNTSRVEQAKEKELELSHLTFFLYFLY